MQERNPLTGKSVRHLRPLTQSAGKLCEFKLSGPSDMSELNEYRIVHMPTMVRASLPFCHGKSPGYQQSMQRHLSGTSKVYETKRGAGMDGVFGRPKCGFKSEKECFIEHCPHHKPGKNPCELNVALQSALHNLPISSVGGQRSFRVRARSVGVRTKEPS